MSETVGQLSALLDSLFQEPALANLRDKYQPAVNNLLSKLPVTQETEFLLDQLPHPKVYRFLIHSKLYYLDTNGRVYQPDQTNASAKLVGRFQGMSFEIEGKVYKLQTKDVVLVPNRADRIYQDAQKRVYDICLEKPVLIGALFGYINNMDQITLEKVLHKKV